MNHPSFMNLRKMAEMFQKALDNINSGSSITNHRVRLTHVIPITKIWGMINLSKYQLQQNKQNVPQKINLNNFIPHH